MLENETPANSRMFSSMRPTILLSFLTVGKIASAALSDSVKLDFDGRYDLKAASDGVGDPLADFDGFGRAYPVEWLPNGKLFNYSGVQFLLPPFHDSSALDTMSANSQVLSVPAGNYQSFHCLLTQTGSGAKAVEFEFVFNDNTSQTSKVVVGTWWAQNPFDGPIHTPFHYTNAFLDATTINHNVTGIHYGTTRILNDKKLVSLKLPSADSNVRIFSISLLSANSTSESPSLRVENVQSTTKWRNSNGTDSSNRIQQIEVTISNIAPLKAGVKSWITSPVSLIIESDSVKTVIPGFIKRLRSNDRAVVVIGISSSGIQAGTAVSAKIIILDATGNPLPFSNGGDRWDIIAGIPPWQSDDASMSTHAVPEWFDDSKFGIFIHYGLYSVPAWAPTGKQYAEWYNWDVHNPANGDNPTRQHHLATYGSNVTYDDFLANWTASAWNPDDWTDLFAESGAKYFVLVTKHHDGVVLFDTNSTDRTSVKLGPKRNFLKELFESAKNRHPELRRGTYFSLPEWFNPAYKPHGKVSFPGGPALDIFTGECCDPYTGYIPVDNFLEEVQKPQMEALFYQYETDILWCDIGFDSIFPKIGADWYNYAASQGRQVVMNNRCGTNQSDFVTPEYATFSSPLSQKWESSAGIDPFSYGFNQDTPPENYQNSSSILQELVDIVSKGGNFLLDVGPKEDGTIIPEMTKPLLEVGGWLKASGEAIYGTRPWWYQPEDSTMTNVRFTTTTDAFYIIALSRPTGGLKVTAPVPIAPGDTVTLLGGGGNALTWSSDNGLLTVAVGEGELDKVTLPAWAFKVSYTGE